MLKLNHVNLTVSDVQGLATFFEKVFAFTITERRGNGNFAVLEGGRRLRPDPVAWEGRGKHALSRIVPHGISRCGPGSGQHDIRTDEVSRIRGANARNPEARGR